MQANCAIHSLADIISLERRPIELQADQLYQEIGIYCFGRGIFHKEPRTGLEVGEKKLFAIREGDFIPQVTFAWEGAVALASAAEEGMCGSTRYPTFRVNEAICYPPYLVQYFKTPEGRDQLVRISPGSAGRNRVLSLKRIGEVQVPLPPLPEQRRIVARIEELSAKIEKARRLREDASCSLNSLVSSMHLSLAGERELPIGEILQLHEVRVAVVPGERYPQVGVRGFGQGLFKKESITAADTTYKVFNQLYDGAIVLSQVKGWEGAIAVCDHNLSGWFASPEYRTFRCIDGMAVPQYLSAVFTSPWFCAKLSRLSRGIGARRERTRPEHFLALRIPMPAFDQQQRAADVLARLPRVSRLHNEMKTELDAILPSVIDAAFSGRL